MGPRAGSSQSRRIHERQPPLGVAVKYRAPMPDPAPSGGNSQMHRKHTTLHRSIPIYRVIPTVGTTTFTPAAARNLFRIFHIRSRLPRHSPTTRLFFELEASTSAFGVRAERIARSTLRERATGARCHPKMRSVRADHSH